MLSPLTYSDATDDTLATNSPLGVPALCAGWKIFESERPISRKSPSSECPMKPVMRVVEVHVLWGRMLGGDTPSSNLMI